MLNFMAIVYVVNTTWSSIQENLPFSGANNKGTDQPSHLFSAFFFTIWIVFNGLTGYMVNFNTVKPVLNGHSKIDKTKILVTNGSLMKVESIAECSP